MSNGHPKPRFTATCPKLGGGSRAANDEGLIIATLSPELNDSLGGSGGAVTLDEIFRSHARRHPDAVALLDPPDRASFTDGAPRSLTYAEADRAISALAFQFQSLGLPANSAVALQLPNTVESVIALLAILRAGLVAAPLPLLWRKSEASAALATIGARALLTCTHIADVDHGELALQVAAETFSVRFVCCFGAMVPDGAVSLDGVFSDFAHDEPAATERKNPAEHVALVTFDVVPDGVAARAHTHTELLVGGLAIVLEARLRRQAAILGTMLTSSFTTIATTLIPWLLTGGSLALHQPFDPAILTVQQAQQHFDAVVLPGPLLTPLAEAGIIGRGGRTDILAVWRFPERQVDSARWHCDAPLTDILAFGEHGHVAMRRSGEGRPAVLKAGAATAPYATPGAPVLTTIARTAEGTLALGGPMVPHQSYPPTAQPLHSGSGSDVLIDTGYPCRIVRESGAIIVSAGPPGLVSVGGYRFALRELQDLIGRFDADGVLAALPDRLAGQKLAGLAADQAAIRKALAGLGVNPLVGSAFRDRRPDRRAPAA
jgi:hypothetical protein